MDGNTHHSHCWGSNFRQQIMLFLLNHLTRKIILCTRIVYHISVDTSIILTSKLLNLGFSLTLWHKVALELSEPLCEKRDWNLMFVFDEEQALIYIYWRKRHSTSDAGQEWFVNENWVAARKRTRWIPRDSIDENSRLQYIRWDFWTKSSCSAIPHISF